MREKQKRNDRKKFNKRIQIFKKFNFAWHKDKTMGHSENHTHYTGYETSLLTITP